LDEFAEHLDRHRAEQSLARTLAVWGLSQSEAARLFDVSRQAVSKWLDSGVPAERGEAVADGTWRDPLDPSFAAQRGGRWNPPGSFPSLYLNEDQVTARTNLRAFIAGWPYEPEDLRDDNGPVLVGATLPRFPATGRSRATTVATLAFSDWYWT